MTKPSLPVSEEFSQFSPRDVWTLLGPKQVSDGKSLCELIQADAEFWNAIGLDVGYLLKSGQSKGNTATTFPFGDVAYAFDQVISALRNDKQPVNVTPVPAVERLDKALNHYDAVFERYQLKKVSPLEFSLLKDGITKYTGAVVANVLEALTKGGNTHSPTVSLRHVQLLFDLRALKQPAPALESAVTQANEMLEKAGASTTNLHAVLAAAEVEAARHAADANATGTAELQQLKQLTAEAQTTLDEVKKQAKELKSWFEDTLPISEVVVLWRKKEKQHEKNFKRWGVFSFLVLLFGLGYLLPTAPAVGFPPKPVEMLQLLRWSVELSLVVWAARTGLKFAITNFRLQEDAAERAVMAATYMSLEKTNPLDTTLKASVMSALFRPNGIDSGTDEGPLLIASLLQGAAAKDKKVGP